MKHKPSPYAVYLAGALALGGLQGCTTIDKLTSFPQPEKYTPALTSSYADQERQWKERREKQGNGTAGGAIGGLLGEGLLRLLFPF